MHSTKHNSDQYSDRNFRRILIRLKCVLRNFFLDMQLHPQQSLLTFGNTFLSDPGMGKKLGVVLNTWYPNESPLYIPVSSSEKSCLDYASLLHVVKPVKFSFSEEATKGRLHAFLWPFHRSWTSAFHVGNYLSLLHKWENFCLKQQIQQQKYHTTNMAKNCNFRYKCHFECINDGGITVRLCVKCMPLGNVR